MNSFLTLRSVVPANARRNLGAGAALGRVGWQVLRVGPGAGRQSGHAVGALARRTDVGFVELEISIVIRLLRQLEFVDPSKKSVDPPSNEFAI
jgi:hypothetical protein